jgi:hypothetical protein
MEESRLLRALTGIATPRLHDRLQTALGMLMLSRKPPNWGREVVKCRPLALGR